MAVINNAGVISCHNPFGCKGNITDMVCSAVTAEPSNGMSSHFRDNLHICRAVRDRIHHFQATPDPAEADRLIADGDDLALGSAVIHCSAKTAPDDQAAAFTNIFLNDTPGREIVISLHDNSCTVD